MCVCVCVCVCFCMCGCCFQRVSACKHPCVRAFKHACVRVFTVLMRLCFSPCSKKFVCVFVCQFRYCISNSFEYLRMRISVCVCLFVCLFVFACVCVRECVFLLCFWASVSLF